MNFERILKHRELELSALMEVTQAINQNLPADSLIKIFNFTLRANLSVKAFAIFLENEDLEWRCKECFGGPKAKVKEYVLPAEVLAAKYITAIPEITTDPLLQHYSQLLPVRHHDKTLAYLLVGSAEDIEYSVLDFIQTLANVILVAIENQKLIASQIEQEALKREMEYAKKVQSQLIPLSLPQDKDLQVSAFYQPHQNIGGDYYDVIQLDEHKYAMCVADVSGKGIPAAMVMSNFQSALRILIRREQSIEEIVKELNQLIYQNASGSHFITFFLAIVETDKRRLRYVNAGHNYPYVVSGGKQMELTKGCIPLAILEEIPLIESERIYYEEDSLLFAYTDGLTESENTEDEEFGEERILIQLNEYKKFTTEELNTIIMDSLDKFRQEVMYKDDITLLSARLG